MQMEGRRKLQALKDCCTNEHDLFYRTFIVGQDGIIDLIEDDNHASPAHTYEGLRPGLWRSFVRRDESVSYDPAMWAVWTWDDSSATDLLNWMLCDRDDDEDVEQYCEIERLGDEIASQTSEEYCAHELEWKRAKGSRGPSGKKGIALRSRHVLSAELYNYLHDDAIERPTGTVKEQFEQLPKHWQEILEDCFTYKGAGSDMTIDDNAGAQLGGAVIASKGGEYPESFAKDEDGMIIGILLGNMFEDGHIMSDAFDVVEYEEALEDLADDVENAILTCVHGGKGPPFEQETPNYLPSFQITLQREDLEHDTMAAAGKLILDHVLEHQRDLFNPYINLGWMLDKEESWMKNFKPNSPVVTFDPNPLLWAQLRKGKASASAEVVYHLPRLYYAVRRSLSKSTRCCDGCLTRSMRVNAALAEGLVEWTAPGDWHRSTQPNVCSLGRYRQEPIFRYVGCGYALTPTSSYPSIKAAHIWRWTATASEKRFTEREVFDDPLGAFYSMGHQAERPEEVLGHTALLVGQKGERIFADVFGMDLHRGLLFGWLRTKDNEGLIESISAFVLPGYTDDVDSDSSLPPFKKVHIQTYGLPRVIPPPHPDLKGTTVPLVCRQMPNHDSPNLLDDVVVQIPTTILNGDQHVEGVFQQAIGSFIIKHQLLHPLILSRFKQYGEKQKRLPIYGTSEQNDEHKAMAAHIARGQAPADFGYTYRFAISQMHPDDWEPSERLPVQGARQQPAEGAWIAPADWFEPCKPTIDPTGQYQAVDVMSYVGCGHVLPPWATYPPDKTKYVWTRLPSPQQGNVAPASTYFDVHSATYKIPEPQDQSQSLKDVLGQTAMFTQGQWDRHILDVIGIDQPRGLVFGFSRLESYKQDKFRALRLINVDSSSSGMQNPGVGPDDYETKTFDKYGVFVVEPKPIQPAPSTGGFSFAMGSRTFENIANGTWHLNQG